MERPIENCYWVLPGKLLAGEYPRNKDESSSELKLAIRMSAESSRTTHGATACIDACRYLGALIVGALQGATKEQLLSPRFAPSGASSVWNEAPLCVEIDDIAAGSFRRKEPPEIAGTGHVVKALEAALWAFHKTES